MANQNKAKPNIVFILTDDQGFWALGSNGNNEVITPNLDKLANEGARFENFFCASPVCSPARATLLTGRMPSQHGVHDWIRKGNMGEDAIEYLKGMRGYTEDLVDMGYTCALSGKWHLGDSINPQKGFTKWYAHQGGGSDYYNAPVIENGVPKNEEKYLTYAITDNAVKYLDELTQDDKPFYLSVNYTAPHSPWLNGNHPKELMDLYEDCPFNTFPRTELHKWAVFSTASNAIRREDVDDPKPSWQGYYASITGVDRGVGDIVEKLKEAGVYDNTIIIFTADNGFNIGHHGIWGKGNGTFPFNMYDTSVKVPMIIWHPETIEPKVVKQMVSAYDFMPTLLDYLGAKDVQKEELPGKSFAKVLKENVQDEQNDAIVVFDEYGPVRMIRTQTDKLVYRYPYGEDEYYDLTNDPDEENNLIDSTEHKERIWQLKQKMQNWFDKYTDPNMDGRLERVSGNGQLDKAGMNAGKMQNYEPCTYVYHVIV